MGKQFKDLKSKSKKSENISAVNEKDTRLHELNEEDDLGQKSIDGLFTELKELLSEEAFSRLKETGTGLHLKVSFSSNLHHQPRVP